MKKILLLILLTTQILSSNSQVHHIDFGTSNTFFSCEPPVYTTTNQSQCTFNNPVVTPIGSSVIYTTTAAGSIGADCRNWLRLSNPGYSFIGEGSELQLRNAGNGSTILKPARFVVKDFTPGTKFGITFDIALAGYGGAFYFRCGSGETYRDTVYMISRNSSSFAVMKIDGTNPAITQPSLRYSSSLANTMWPNVPSYSFVSGINSTFPVYQKHTIAIFGNNSSVPVSYTYMGARTLQPSTYEVYVDSVLDATMFDDFFQNGRTINSFMFGGGSSMCANGGQYLGDTLLVDNIRWTSDFSIFPLPVHLSSFTAKYQSNKTVVLNWRDETPEAGTKFTIQLVNSGGLASVSIGEVIEQADRKDYSFTYNPPANTCGKLFFRLSFEGKYSEVRSIDIPCTGPKITGGKQSVTISTKLSGTIAITSMLGQPVARTVLAIGQTTISAIVPIGVYIARFVGNNGKVYTQKVFIQ